MKSYLSVLHQLWNFFRTEKRWFLLPLVILLLLFGVIAVAAQSSFFAPFLYTLF